MKVAKADFDMQSLFSSPYNPGEGEGKACSDESGNSGPNPRPNSEQDSPAASLDAVKPDGTVAVFRPGQLPDVRQLAIADQGIPANDPVVNAPLMSQTGHADHSDDLIKEPVRFLATADVAEQPIGSESEIEHADFQHEEFEQTFDDSPLFEEDLASAPETSNLVPVSIAIAIIGAGCLAMFVWQNPGIINPGIINPGIVDPGISNDTPLASAPGAHARSVGQQVLSSTGSSVPLLSAAAYPRISYFDFSKDRLVPVLTAQQSANGLSEDRRSLTISTDNTDTPIVSKENDEKSVSEASKQGNSRSENQKAGEISTSVNSVSVDAPALGASSLASVPGYRRSAESWKAEIVRLLEKEENLIARIEYRLLRRTYPDLKLDINLPR